MNPIPWESRWWLGLDGRPVLTNPALQKMLGYTNEELMRMPFREFTHPEDCARDRGTFQQLLCAEAVTIWKSATSARTARWFGRVSRSASRKRKGGHRVGFAIGLMEDITERRKLEAQFIEAQKMEAIGQLAGGVAHDFNNILAVIMGYSDLMIVKLRPDSPLQKDAQTIRQAAERAAGLTRQLLVFSRKQTVQPVVLNLNTVVGDMEKMLARLIDENVELTFAMEPQIGRLKADSGYVGQVLMNLVVNARDAMPNGGKITVQTSNATLDQDYARTHPARFRAIT